MFLYNKKKGYMVNVDMLKDIFLGRESGTLAIGFKNGAATKLIAYSSEVEALEAINMITFYITCQITVLLLFWNFRAFYTEGKEKEKSENGL